MRAKNVDILFFIEHKDRELETIVAIAHEIKKKYKLKIEIKSIIFHSLLSALFLRPKVIVSPSSGFGKGSVSRNFHTLYQGRIKYVNLNYEQFICSWNEGFKLPKYSKGFKQQKQFVWGQHFADILKKWGIPPDNIYITGRPLYTLLKNQYKDKKAESRQQIHQKLGLDLKKEWLFIAMTDPLAFSTESEMKHFIEAGCEEKELRKNKKEVEFVLNTLLNWLSKLDQNKLKKYHIIIRPHPSISESQYHSYIKKHLGKSIPSLIISKSFNAHLWLAAADKYYTNFSTLALDASLFKIPIYILNPNGIDDHFSPWFCKTYPKILNYKEFEESFSDSPRLYGSMNKIPKTYLDISLDGISCSTKYLHAFVKQISTYPKLKTIMLMRLILYAPKRLFGSLIRYFLVRFGLSALVKKGIYMEFFTEKEITISK